jgi:hypothetical protein
MFWFLLTLVLNFGISWLNARAAGSIWSESKAIGGALRFHAIAAYALAILGFTSVYGSLLIVVSPMWLPLIFSDMDMVWTTATLMADMQFILTALFIIPLGFYAWVTSFISFWRRRSLMNGLALGWNTFANIRNTMTVARHAPSAMGRIAKTLFGGKKDGKALMIMVVIFVFILAIVGGWLTASAIMHRMDENTDAFEGMHAHDDPNFIKG